MYIICVYVLILYWQYNFNNDCETRLKIKYVLKSDKTSISFDGLECFARCDIYRYHYYYNQYNKNYTFFFFLSRRCKTNNNKIILIKLKRFRIIYYIIIIIMYPWSWKWNDYFVHLLCETIAKIRFNITLIYRDFTIILKIYIK